MDIRVAWIRVRVRVRILNLCGNPRSCGKGIRVKLVPLMLVVRTCVRVQMD